VETTAVEAGYVSVTKASSATAVVVLSYALTGWISGSGASSQMSAQSTWSAAFQTSNPNVTITYDPTGSGAGRKTFINAYSDFAGSDSYLSSDELKSTFAACAPSTKPFEVPAYISPIAVIYNLPGVTDLNLDASTLAKIFAGTITTWNDPAIVALNPQAKLPATPITAVHRSDDSGTSKNFSDYLFQTAQADWPIEAPTNTWPVAGGWGAQGTSGVVAAVTNGTGTIGYADAFKAGKLGIANIKVGDKFVKYTPEAAAAVVAESKPVDGRAATDMAIEINRTTTDSTHYPIVLVSYLIGCNQYVRAGSAALVKPYFEYILSPEGQATVASTVGSAPLSAAQATKALAIISGIK
jgi:phosphate transport system substrate-binding protein